MKNDSAEAVVLKNEQVEEALPEILVSNKDWHTIEALGVAWCDVYKVKRIGDNGATRLIKISLTSRSDFSPQDALEKLFEALTWAHERGYNPYVP